MKELLLCFLLLCTSARAESPSVADDTWGQLSQQVEARRIDLAALIKQANQQGLATDYAAVSEQVIRAFQTAAQHDHANRERVREIFKTFRYYDRTDPTEAEQLPFKELRACLEVAEHALTELRQQLSGTVTLSRPPDFSQGKMALGPGYYRLDGQVVFPSSLVWMPKEEGYMQAFGRLGEAYYQLGHLRESEAVDAGVLQRAVASLENQCSLNAAPLVYFMGHAPARWMKERHPEILQGSRHFTQYDIDSPLIRAWIEKLCAGMLPGLTRVGGKRPQVHLLANEPHFATAKGGWRASNGLSEFSIQKYRQWLAAKYHTIDAVNDSYGTPYASFDRVKPDLPVHPALRGSAFWYDWCRFNMDRVIPASLQNLKKVCGGVFFGGGRQV